MYAVFELGLKEKEIKGDDSIICIDANIQSLSWMNKSTNTNETKLINYQEGWLATGNSNSMVGCTLTSCLSEDEYFKKREKLSYLNIEASQNLQTVYDNNNNNSTTQNIQNRTNFNLRGHKTDIKLVRFNNLYQKLATCDSKGVINVWVKYEGRWSIELINDRGNSVADFAWSHDGKMAVICYTDGFVLVGSVNGTRFWSNFYDLPNLTIICATFAPNDNFVLIGLSNGHLMVVDEQGTILTRHYLLNGEALCDVQYNCPKFFTNHYDIVKQNDENFTQLNSNRLRLSANLNERMNFIANNNNTDTNKINNDKKNTVNNSDYIIACLFQTNCNIYLLKNYDDLDPVIIDTKLEGVKLEWSNCGKFLSVGGVEKFNASMNNKPNNFVHFYNLNGVIIFRIKVPIIINENILNSRLENKLLKQNKHFKPVIQQKFSCLTWGHNDQRLFIACSSTLHILRIFKTIPKFSLLTQISIKSSLKELYEIKNFNLPNHLKEEIKYLCVSTIKNKYPKLSKLRQFVSSSLPKNERFHCTLKCLNKDNKNSKNYYVLYLEYLGGLIPLLTARKTSKIKPNFIIFDPYFSKITQKNSSNSSQCLIKLGSDTNLWKIKKTSKLNIKNRFKTINDTSQNSLKKKHAKINSNSINKYKKFHKDNSKKRILVEIKSNIWGTKFEFTGHNYLPHTIGKIFYKTSLFHLQPRQMKIVLDELTGMSSFNQLDSNNNLKKINKSCDTILKREKSNKKLSSIQRLASATLGAIPSTFSYEKNKLITNEFDSLNNANLNKFPNCNDKIATVQQLIENKFDKNENFFMSKSFNLPILSLVSSISKNDFENEYIFTSNTKKNDSINFTNQADQKIINYDERKNSLFSALKREILFPSIESPNFLNFLRNNSYMNKDPIEKEYQKFNGSSKNKIKSNNIGDKNSNIERISIEEIEKITNLNNNKQFILQNKPPIWNETNQVYQLDFGGRVTQESAKNFQIEFGGKQVMQFGRIDSNAYTLDFEWPFTVVQAFSIALASVTQRLK